MTKPLLYLSLMAALAGAPVWAQQAQDDADAPAGDTATEDRPLGGELDLGEGTGGAPQGQPQAPQTYIKETFTDWQLQCIDVPDDQGEDVCQMYQLLKDENGANVAEASIFKLTGGGQAVAGGTFIVPLETLLTEKLTIQVDGGQARRYDFAFCAPIGCYARLGFTAEDIQRFKAGAVANLTIVPALAPNQKVTVRMSLSGFTAAFDASSALNP